MKKTYLIGLLFIVGLVCGCRSTPTEVVFESPQQIKNIKIVAVFPFISNRSQTGQIIADALAANLEKSRFSVIEQGRLQQLLKAQRLSLQRVSDDHRCAVGRLKGVDAIITGSASVRAFGGYTEHVAEAAARMIDMTSGETLLEVIFSSEDARGVKGTTPADQIGRELAHKFSSY